MAKSVLEACGLHGCPLPSFTLIRQNAGVDGSFLMAAILTQCLSEQKNAVMFVATHHTSQHYTSACLKLGCNLPLDTDRLQILDVNAKLYSTYEIAPLNPCDPDIEDIFRTVKRYLGDHPTATVIMDDLSYYMNFGQKSHAVLSAVEQLLEYNSAASFVIKCNTADRHEVFCNTLYDYADTDIQLVRFASGPFKEVDGRLNVHRFPPKKAGEEDLMKVKRLEKQVLYKVLERSIKVLAPGEVGIKNS